MKEQPFISVMILCYNYSELLKKALTACAQQTFSDFEIVMINNGSTDDTESVFFNFCKNNPNIRTQYIKIEENQGPTNGWNIGLKAAHGKYILFNDADDWMEPNCLENLATVAKSSNADRVVGQYQEVLPDGTVKRVRTISEHSPKIPTYMLQATIFKKEIIDDNSITIPLDILVPYDAYFTFKFASLEKTKPQFVRKTIYNYFYNPYSICRKMQKENAILSEINNVIIILAEITENAMKHCNDNRLKAEMEYLCIRNNYASIASRYRLADKKSADKFCDIVLSETEKHLPEYRHNKLLKPFNNGYETPGSFATWFLVKLEGVHLLKPFCKLVTKFKFKKLLIESIESENL